MSRILVSGGFFDQTIGLLTVIEKTTEGLVVVSDNEIEHPKPEIAVLGKESLESPLMETMFGLASQTSSPR